MDDSLLDLTLEAREAVVIGHLKHIVDLGLVVVGRCFAFHDEGADIESLMNTIRDIRQQFTRKAMVVWHLDELNVNATAEYMARRAFGIAFSDFSSELQAYLEFVFLGSIWPEHANEWTTQLEARMMAAG